MRTKLEAIPAKLSQVDLGSFGPNSLLIFLAYLGMTVAMTYPVAFRLDSAVVGGGEDTFQHLWSLWWAKKAWLDLGTGLDDIRYLYYPLSVSHQMLSVTPLIQITSLPLVLLLGPLAAYNIHFLLTFALSGLTMYWLGLELTENRWAAFIGGAVFAFAPTRFMHGMGHFAQIVTYWFPLYALFAIRLTRSPTWKNAMWTGILLALSSLVNAIHVAYFVIPFTVLWLFYLFIEDRQRLFSRPLVTSLGGTFALAGILVSPFYMPFILGKFAGGLDYFAASGFVSYSCDLLAFLVPPPDNPVVRSLPGITAWAHFVLTGLDGNEAEGTAYTGIVSLILALVGVVRQWRQTRFWVWLGIVAAVLSLGPLLKFNGELVRFTVDSKTSYIVLPYALLMQLPFYEWVRNPGRLAGTTMFALAVLASYGTARILPIIRREWTRSVLVGTMVVLIAVEYLVQFPYPAKPVPIPEFYSRLRAENDEFAILDYPIFRRDPELNMEDFHKFNYPMYYQTQHEYPIIGGYTWRLPSQVKGTMKTLSNLVAPKDELWPDILENDLSLEERLHWLDGYNIRYVVLRHQNSTTAKATHRREALATMFGSPVYEDQFITAFKVPKGVATSSGSVPLLAIGSGWHSVEQVADRFQRWLSASGDLYAYPTAEGIYRLVFNAEAFNDLKHLVILVNDQRVTSMAINSYRRFVSPDFTLQPGMNEIRFEADSCQEGVDIGSPDADTRCLSMLFSNVKLVSADDAVSQVEVGANFSDAITLLGYDLASEVFRPGDDVRLTLHWQANQQVTQDWSVFAHILDDRIQIVAQQDNMPVNDRYPTSWWAVGEVVEDEYVIHIPENAAPGTHMLEVGLYLFRTGERLRILDTGGDRVILTDIEIR